MQRRGIALFGAIALLVLPIAAYARPVVSLKLAGSVIVHVADGKDSATPLEKNPVRPGDLVRYEIDAANNGDSAAKSFTTIGKIPAGTAFVPGSASAATGPVEYSLDGGKTWSARPMVTVQTPAGPQTKPADPAAYTTIRWITSKPIEPKSTIAYTYEVRVNK